MILVHLLLKPLRQEQSWFWHLWRNSESLLMIACGPAPEQKRTKGVNSVTKELRGLEIIAQCPTVDADVMYRIAFDSSMIQIMCW
jgi:hypothetical protein